MKEIYTSNHIWTLFENFTLDMAQVRGEGWVGWLGWGQGGVTKAPLKPPAGHGYTCGTSYSCHTWGWGVVRAVCPSAQRGPSSLWADRSWPGAISVLPVLTDVQEEGEAPAGRHAGEVRADGGAGHHQRVLQLALLREQHLTAGDTSGQGGRGGSSSARPPKLGLGACADSPVSPRPTRPSWCSSSSPP